MVGDSEKGLIGKGDVDVLDSGDHVGFVLLGGFIFHLDFGLGLDLDVVFGFSQINGYYFFPLFDILSVNII